MPPRLLGAAADDRGMAVLEQKLSILTHGPSRTRRNLALDVLTGRVPDERLAALQANLLTLRPGATDASSAASSSLRTAAGSARNEAGSLHTDAGLLRSEAGSLHTEAGLARTEAGLAREEAGSLRAETGALRGEAGFVHGEAADSRSALLGASGPTAMVLPVAAIRMAAVARSSRLAPSPWLRPTSGEPRTLRLVPPPPSRWSKVPWLGAWLERLFGEREAYRWAHMPS